MSDKVVRRYVYPGVMRCRCRGTSSRDPVCDRPADFFLSWQQRYRSGRVSWFEKPLCEEHARLCLGPDGDLPGPVSVSRG